MQCVLKIGVLTASLVALTAGQSLAKDTTIQSPARRYAVTGEDLAGRATIQGRSVTLQVTTFAKRSSKTQTLRGTIVARTRRVLRWRYTRRVKSRRGFISRLAFWKKSKAVERTFEVVMRRSSGAWVGEVEGVRQVWRLQRNLSDVIVLVVPGLSTNLWNQYGVPYLDENMQALKARGLRARRLEINTEASVATNAAYIAREVRAEIAAGRRVLLFAHSKGGTDAVTALADPENADLLPHVVGLIAIQPVYGGSDVSDLVDSNGLLRATATKFFERVLPKINRETDTGSGDAILDLTTAHRRAALAEHPYPVDQIPTVVIRGSFSGRKFFRFRHVLRKPLWVFQRYFERKDHLQTDGLVSLAKQRIPGAKVEITLTDIDHFEPGFRGESPHSPVEITNRALDAMLPFIRSRGRRLPPRRVPVRPIWGLPFPK